MAVAKQVAIYGNGFDLSGALKEFTIERSRAMLDSTTLNKASQTFEAGLKTAKFSASGVWDYDATNSNKIHELITNAFKNQTTVLITAGRGAIVVGDYCDMLTLIQSDSNVADQLGMLTMISVSGNANDDIDRGVWLYNATLSATTANSASVDNAASSANGGIGHAHLQNTTATIGSCTVKFQHSVDNSTWVDLGTATAFTAGMTNQGFLSQVFSGTVNRYVRAVVTTVGGSATIQAAFARR